MLRANVAAAVCCGQGRKVTKAKGWEGVSCQEWPRDIEH